MSVVDLLKRPPVRIALFALLVPVVTLLFTATVSSLGQSWRGPIAALAVAVVMLPFVAASAYSIPGRYLTNPQFDRKDIPLGALTIGSLVLLVACPLLVFLAADGQSPAPALFVGAGLIAGIGAGGLNALSRQRFPQAWAPVARRVEVSRVLPSATASGTSLTIRPTRMTRGVVVVFLGGLCLWMIYFDVINQTIGPEIAVFLPLLAFVALILMLTAGCNEDRVWFAWRSVPRSEVAVLELTRRPSLGADYGAIRLLGPDGTLALAIPTLFFADLDIDRLVRALALPQREI